MLLVHIRSHSCACHLSVSCVQKVKHQRARHLPSQSMVFATPARSDCMTVCFLVWPCLQILPQMAAEGRVPHVLQAVWAAVPQLQEWVCQRVFCKIRQARFTPRRCCWKRKEFVVLVQACCRPERLIYFGMSHAPLTLWRCHWPFACCVLEACSRSLRWRPGYLPETLHAFAKVVNYWFDFVTRPLGLWFAVVNKLRMEWDDNEPRWHLCKLRVAICNFGRWCGSVLNGIWHSLKLGSLWQKAPSGPLHSPVSIPFYLFPVPLLVLLILVL